MESLSFTLLCVEIQRQKMGCIQRGCSGSLTSFGANCSEFRRKAEDSGKDRTASRLRNEPKLGDKESHTVPERKVTPAGKCS